MCTVSHSRFLRGTLANIIRGYRGVDSANDASAKDDGLNAGTL